MDAPSPWPDGALALGSLVNGRFQVQRVLGVGGFGITYAAWDHHLQRHVAIKEFLPSDTVRSTDGSISSRDLSGFHAGLERFLTEGRVLAKLNHPGIVGVFDVLSAHGTAYLVMDYLVGETVDEALERDGRFNVATTTRLLNELCGALSFLHNEAGDPGRASLLHLDVSPSNIMLVDGPAQRPVLIDLGSARVAAASGTREYSRIVKAGFSAPELYSAVTPRSAASDVYSLCATAYSMLIGVPPPDCLERAQGAELRGFEEQGVSVPPLLSSAVLKGMSLRVDDRPATISAFYTLCASALGRQASDPQPVARLDTRMVPEPVLNVQPDTPSTIHRDAAGRPRRLTVAIAGILCTVVAAVGLAFVGTRSSTSGKGVVAAPGSADGVSTPDRPLVGDPSTTVGRPSTVDATVVSQQTDSDGEAVVKPVERAVVPVSVSTAFQRASVRRNCGSEGRLAFPAMALIDGDPQTGWGVSSGDGTGASITVELGRSFRVSRIGLIPGFVRQGKRSDLGCQSVNAFYYNRVVTAVRYDFDDGSSVVHQLQAQPDMQFIKVAVTTARIRMTILGTQRTRDNDTIIFELSVFEHTTATP